MSGKAERLDPVRWRGPTRGLLPRLIVIAVLLVTAAGALWVRPTPCPPAASAPPSARVSTSPSSGIPPDTVGVPVRLTDPTALAVVKPGNRVDLLRVSADHDSTPVASDVLVLDVTGTDDPVSGGLLLALSRNDAHRAVAAPGEGFAVLIRPG